ncbi:GNAT family N-acetyltransferase, partial [Acinetobacter baumannii]|nr:GNAT family N-acetyltransferase [Acinetobacter baumannii]
HCVQYPAQILTVDASITAKPCFTAHGFKVVAEQRVAARGEWFINYRMEKRVALR